MTDDFQRTLKKSYTFEGKGLHSGLKVKMILTPAPENTGIVFIRQDLGDDARVEAIVDYVTHTQRGTTLEKGEVKVSTIEHILSTFVGLGIDNALVYLSSFEAPIMDGSAKPFANAIEKDGLITQDSPRKYFEVKEKIYLKDEKTGSELTLIPSPDYSLDITIDYNSRVMGVQTASYSSTDSNYTQEIAPCRTFVFFHELAFLYKNNLIKGGDLENAIVIAEHDVPQSELDAMAELFNVRTIKRIPEGYLDNVVLRFDNECARHKLLDIMGDFALTGFRIKGKVVASKSGHQINTQMARLIRAAALNEI